MAESIFGLSNTNFSGTGASALAANKLEHEHRANAGIDTSTAVTTTTFPLFISRGVGTLISFEAAIIGAVATGADRTVTIDLQRSTGFGSRATVLSAPIVFNNSTVLHQLTSAAISNTAVADGDYYVATVTVAGAAGAQAIGLVLSLTWKEVSSQ